MFEPWRYEDEAHSQGFTRIGGVDEAGRGPIAGPVVAAAIVLPRDFDCSVLCDSKAMTPLQRESAYECIMARAVAVGIGIVGPGVIDEINILNATRLAMNEALKNMGDACDFVLVDGLPVAGLIVPSKAIVKGDASCASIMAASIVAKVTRDRIMIDLDSIYPNYGFRQHKGYATRAHLEAIQRWGPCDCHRKSFAPIRERIGSCCLPGLE